MKLAYITTRDLDDVHAWSGTVNYMRNMLRDSGFDIFEIGNLKAESSRFLNYKKRLIKRFFSCRYFDDRHPKVLKSYHDEINNILSSKPVDVIFSHSSIVISDLKTSTPIVFWTDATFAGMLEFYPSFSSLCQSTIRYGNRQEKMSLKNCRLAIYSSDWAAKSAINFYGVDPDKVKVVPFGANVNCDRTENDILNLVNKKKAFDPLKLLFVGKNWERKGGETALEVAKSLHRRGINTELHIVGCKPDIDLPYYVVEHGFISKKTSDGRNYLDRLYSDAHFFILPSKAEAFGIVFAEASSFGLPSLASNVGGIPTAVRDGFNGYIFALNSNPEDYTKVIDACIKLPKKYESLALSSFSEYKTRLNWNVSGEIVRNLIFDFCS